MLKRWMVLLAFGCVLAGWAVPDLGHPRAVGAIPKLYPDTVNPRIFYYPPEPLTLVKDLDLAPAVSFLQIMRPATVGATADPVARTGRSLITLHVQMPSPKGREIGDATKLLPPGSQIRPMPFLHTKATLSWAGSGGAPLELGQARFERPDPQRPLPRIIDSWSDRVVVCDLEPIAAQELWRGIQDGAVSLTLTYSILVQAIATGESTPQPVAILTGGLTTVLDAAQWPTHFRRVEKTIPDRFPALAIRCDKMKPDVIELKVEVEVQMPGGKTLSASIIFDPRLPSQNTAAFTFEASIPLDTPFKTRTIEVMKDGKRVLGEWTERTDWFQPIDISFR